MATTLVQAEVVTKYQEAIGTGGTRNAAVVSALENAVGKAFGFQLEGKLQRTLSERSNYTLQDSEEDITAIMSRQVTQRVGTSSNNPVTSYEILTANESTVGWEASVRIHYKDFKKLGAKDNRRSLVVRALDDKSTAFAGIVESALIASRRFNVLSRDNADVFNEEKAFILSSDASRSESARVGRAEGADYIVLVKTDGYFSRLNRERVIKATGEHLYQSDAGFRFEVEVVEFASREMKWHKREKIYVSSKRKVASASSLLSGKTERYANNMVLSLVSSIYPARIAQVIGDRAVLNRGEGSIKVGQNVEVYHIGEKIIDPQSGESLGAMEIEVAKAKVIELKPKFSILQLTSGKLDKAEDYVVRWNAKTSNTNKSNKKTSTTKNRQNKAKSEAKALDNSFLN